MDVDPEDDHVQMLNTNFMEEVQECAAKFVASYTNYVKLSADDGSHLDSRSINMDKSPVEKSAELQQVCEALQKSEAACREKDAVIKLLRTTNKLINQVISTKYAKK